MSEKEDNIHGDLVPTLRQGIDIIKMVLFKELKPHMEKHYPQLAPEEAGRLTGAVINNLFGIEDMEKSVETFNSANQHLIHAEVAAFAENFDHLRIPLTDALRVQYLDISLRRLAQRQPVHAPGQTAATAVFQISPNLSLDQPDRQRSPQTHCYVWQVGRR